MSWLKTWWVQPDQYEWITAFLQQRGMLRSARMGLAALAGSSALVPLTVLPSQGDPSAVELTIGVVAATITLAVTALLVTRWPTRLQSHVGVTLGALGVGGWSLVQPTAALAALAATAMAIPGGYIAFFHGPKLLLFNGAVALAVAATAVFRLAHEVNLATAASAFWINVFLNITVPLGIWGMAKTMGMYVERSEKDALTGLLNRRAFTDAVSNRLANPLPAHAHLAVVMVDLDNFKRINDTHGHVTGDRVLRAVAELLHEHAPADAVVCRAGGEEFLVAMTTVTPDVRPLTAQFCSAVAELIPKITASIGTASTEIHRLAGPDAVWLVEELIEIADGAMYSAKRRGGNQVHHTVGA
ncbi:GGDEF domain-containing protein [Mycobacterium rhizamassiliense]|uniref:GGDEF domain-containing protein n=1 Tax=Mycobacterium rhizamassiliense TaxID=1841860 RepID=A0A2U3NQ82_9MYCO|nr:GGDEF domain-containing protein [Mycobacterium rhizamassiliense]SPM33672.1 GGDEF domain-containing protein [Mycobacterium rhizamassiliense]